MEHEFDCPKCDLESSFKITLAGSDNGLPGSYFQSFLEADEVSQECQCGFTKAEMSEFLQDCAKRVEEEMLSDE